MNLIKLQPLFKRTANGGVQVWEIAVEENPDGTATITTTYGLIDGQKQTIQDVVREGKNLGKRNATSAFTQARAEMQAKWDKQRTRKLYALDVNDSQAAREEAPMLAQDYLKHLKKVDWKTSCAQPKLDGFRCLAKKRDGEIYLQSREGKPIETMPHIVEMLQKAMSDDDTLDGELYLPGMEFQQIASRVKRLQEGSAQIQYHVYDALLDAPFAERYHQAHAKIRRLDPNIIVPVKTIVVPDLEALMAFQANCLEEGYEGAMLRHGVDGYDAGKRSSNLLKVKNFVDAEFVITGVREGRGTHVGMAIFLCQTEQGAEFEVLAPGTHEEKRQFWTDREQCVGRKLTVKYQELTTTEQPVPRFPVARRLHAVAS